MKTFKCKNIMPDCNWQISADDEKIILDRAFEHGKEKHGLVEFSDELKQKVRSHIYEEKAA